MPIIPDKSTRAGNFSRTSKIPYQRVNPKDDMDENDYYRILIEMKCKDHMKNKKWIISFHER